MKVARILTRPNLGGPTRQAVALWHAHRAQGIDTLLLCGTCAPDEPSVDLEAAGIPCVPIGDVGTGRPGFVRVPGLARRVSPLQDLAAIRTTRRLLDAWGPDVVHTHTSKAGIVGCIASSAPVVHTYHGIVLRDYAGRVGSTLAHRAERWAERHRDAVVAVSASCRDELTALGLARGALLVPPAVETAGAKSRANGAVLPGRRDGAPAIGFVGRLVPIKQPELFVDLANAFPGVDAYVAGAGPLGRVLAQVAPRNLHVLGPIDDIGSVLAGLDLLILPSRREGFPVVAVEAAAFGVPTLGFTVPGLVDLASYGGVALLAPAASGFDGLASALRGFLEAPCRASGPGAERLVADCHPERVATLLAGIYERCTQKGSAVGGS